MLNRSFEGCGGCFGADFPGEWRGGSGIGEAFGPDGRGRAGAELKSGPESGFGAARSRGAVGTVPLREELMVWDLMSGRGAGRAGGGWGRSRAGR